MTDDVECVAIVHGCRETCNFAALRAGTVRRARAVRRPRPEVYRESTSSRSLN
jgi:hypothetical protein